MWQVYSNILYCSWACRKGRSFFVAWIRRVVRESRTILFQTDRWWHKLPPRHRTGSSQRFEARELTLEFRVLAQDCRLWPQYKEQLNSQDSSGHQKICSARDHWRETLLSLGGWHLCDGSDFIFDGDREEAKSWTSEHWRPNLSDALCGWDKEFLVILLRQERDPSLRDGPKIYGALSEWTSIWCSNWCFVNLNKTGVGLYFCASPNTFLT